MVIVIVIVVVVVVIIMIIIVEQLMNEAEYLLKNYGDRGGCTASTDNTLRDLHNSSCDKKAEFNNRFIIHSK